MVSSFASTNTTTDAGEAESILAKQSKRNADIKDLLKEIHTVNLDHIFFLMHSFIHSSIHLSIICMYIVSYPLLFLLDCHSIAFMSLFLFIML